MWVGLAGALLVFVGLSTLHALVVPPLAPFDEPAHFAYARHLAKGGELPTIDTKIEPRSSPLVRKQPRKIWVANHPPLYYALVAPLVGTRPGEVGIAAATQRARTATLALSAVGLIYVFLLARLLLPRRPAVALAATLVTACIPALGHVSALVHNDALAFLTSAALMHAATAALVRGPAPSRVAVACFWAAACALTRFTGVVTLGAASLALFFAGLFHARGGWGRRAGVGVLLGALVGGAAVLAAGWFFARNVHLYGDLTGATKLLGLFGRRGKASVVELALRGKTWLALYDDLFGRFGAGARIKGGAVLLGRALVVLGALGAVTKLDAFRRAYDKRALLASPRTAAVLVEVVLLAGLLAGILSFHAKGGSLHARYLLPGLWVLALALVVPLGVRRSAIGLLLMMVAALGAALFALAGYAAFLLGGERAVLAALGKPSVGLALACACGGAVLCAIAVVKNHRAA